MIGSNPPKRKYERNDEVTEDDYLEGTSARTRPLSFDDIMLARKNKADTSKQGISGPRVTDVALARNVKTSSPECHKQTNEDSDTKDNRHSLADSAKLNSLRKGDNKASRGNKRFVSDKDKGSWEHYPKLKSVVDKNISNERVTEVTTERYYHYRKEKHTGEKDGLLGDHSDNGSDRRQSRGLAKKEKGSETSRGKSKMDRKQPLNEERQVSRKRKIDGRTASDSEYKKRNERDMMLTDKLTDRGREKSEKEVRHKHYNEEDKPRGKTTGEKHSLEKKGVESTSAHHGKSKSKRRRSHSKEHAKERGGKSLSQSSKAHKHRSRDKREHGELSPNSTKDRSGKESSDVDKKISSNGSSNQYRRNTVSSSGLGGYSPRKRKTNAAAKTPSPTHRSPARRTAGWDLQPVETESAIAGSTFSDVHMSQILSMNIEESPSSTPVAPIVMKPIGIPPHTLSSQMHAIESIQLTQATRPMRRLYVESLPASASEKDLIECINKFLLSSGVNYIRGTQPCISCIIHKEKGQALLEFLTPEDASAALSFDGISFCGSNLKLRRPKDYATISTGVPDKSVVAVDSVSDNVEDSPHKIFIGGIPKFISSKMLLEIARAFGPVKAFHYEYIADIKEPCAFLEYVDHSVASKACAGLNGMRLGGKVLAAVFATPDADMEDVGKLPFYGIPEHAKPLLEKPSAVLELKNALDPQDLLSLSESKLEELLEDVRIECSRFGTVKSINIAKPTSSPTAKEAVTETTNASIDRCTHEVAGLDHSGFPGNVNALENTFQNAENISSCDDPTGISDPYMEPEDTSLPDDINSDSHFKDEMCKPTSVDANVSTEEFGGQQILSVNELETNNPVSDPFSPKDESKLEESNAKDGDSVELDTSDRLELSESSKANKVFEAGCIFVEYSRAEAACMAAHCLHGRSFDGRVVTVGYVSPGLYHMRFRK